MKYYTDSDEVAGLRATIHQLDERCAIVAKREAELHYGIRRDANILDKRLSEDEAHAEALFRVAKMHDVVEAAHEVNRQMKATNGKVTVGAWAKLADALDMRVPTSERSSAAVVVEDPKPLRPLADETTERK